MVIYPGRFNFYLVAVALVATLTGCASASYRKKNEIATLRLHLEVRRDMGGDGGQPVMISRAAKIQLNVEKQQFLDEANVAKASVVEGMGGFTILIEFDHRGTLLLEQYSAVNPGKRIAVLAQWGEKQAESRWLAAPLINRRIGDGILNFTPDATRAEADEIVHGLNNVAIENGNQEKPKNKPKDKPKPQ